MIFSCVIFLSLHSSTNCVVTPDLLLHNAVFKSELYRAFHSLKVCVLQQIFSPLPADRSHREGNQARQPDPWPCFCIPE